MTALTPGLAQSAIELLRLLERRRLSTDDLLAGLRRISGIATNEALQLAQALNWLSVGADGVLTATAGGGRVAGIGSYELALRQVLLDFAELIRPEWIQNASHGRTRVLAFAGIGVAQTLIEAGVAGGTDDSVVEFWDALAARARGQRDFRLLSIGRSGERLTIAYEERRTGTVARWVALDSNDDGYDVLSVTAKGLHDPLTIEVKTSTIGMSGSIYITRREWSQAIDSPAHVFHLWDVKDAGAPRLAVVTTDEVERHISIDSGFGSWSETRVPFSAFRDKFSHSP